MRLTSDGQNHTEPSLWSIGVAVGIILGAPLILYSLAPTGPIRQGDTVFSEGQQQVRIHRLPNPPPRKADDTCLLDPNNPLIVLNLLPDHAAETILAQVQGNPSHEWPFCQTHTEVVLKPHQVFQKPAMFTALRDLMLRLAN